MRKRRSTNDWTPRTVEDRLLHEYWIRVGGTLIVEVRIGGAGGRVAWSDKCGVRRIDGVILRAKNGQPVVNRFSSETWEPLLKSSRSVELIEVKPSLNRSAIGQAIVARHLFEHQYRLSPKRVTILCRTGDSALQWVCAKEQIHVEVLEARAGGGSL